jgi:uncharacterized membrane protein YcjF (UPF0283 family)
MISHASAVALVEAVNAAAPEMVAITRLQQAQALQAPAAMDLQTRLQAVARAALQHRGVFAFKTATPRPTRALKFVSQTEVTNKKRTIPRTYVLGIVYFI